MKVKAIQYLRPDGRQRKITTEMISNSFEEQYLFMLSQGRNLALEELTTGEIAVYIEDKHNEQDLFTRVVSNNIVVIDAIRNILDENFKERF